jgi:hypothetical protein
VTIETCLILVFFLFVLAHPRIKRIRVGMTGVDAEMFSPRTE